MPSDFFSGAPRPKALTMQTLGVCIKSLNDDGDSGDDDDDEEEEEL